jgi:DNA-binding NarL/FixJ family response regulator
MGAPMGSNTKARVLIVDDHPLVCKAVSQILNRQSDMVCCGMVQSAMATISAVIERRPNLVLLDLKLKDGDGIKLIGPLLQEVPGLKVLVFSQFNDVALVDGALKAGACGYVSKQETSQEILTAVRTVLAGKIYLNHKISTALLNDLEVLRPPTVDGNVQLTKREAQVLQLIGVGMKTRDVATKLDLSVKTIETYREHLKRKLGLKNSTELTHFAICWMERRS